MNESRFMLPENYQSDPTFMAIYNKIVAIQEAVHADYFKRFGLRLAMDFKLRMQELRDIQDAAEPYYKMLSNYITTGAALTIPQSELA
jgi:hypothetical protein